MRITAVVVLLAALAGAACDREGADAEDVRSSRAPSIDLQQMTAHPSGLHVQDLRTGDGAVVQAGQTILVHYTGWLLDGEQFDSSHDRGQPLDVTIGTGDVIAGWDEGVPGMRVGGRRRLVIPSELAYGSAGAGDVIPPDATLVFDVEVVDIVGG